MTLFEELKIATKPLHDELEAELDLLSPKITIDDYRKILEKFWGVYVPVESSIRNSEIKNQYEGRWKSELLKDDLLALGLKLEDIEKLPLHEISTENISDLLGTLYVLEGSTLGGIILSRHFHFRFHLPILNGLSFFTGYGDKTLIRWKEWREFSEEFAQENNLSSPTIISQAKKTFTELRNWMCCK